MNVHVYIGVHSFRRRYIRFGAYPKCIHIQIFVKTTCKYISIKLTGLRFGLVYLMPDYWLIVSLHPEGPATGQLNQGFPWLSLVPEQMLSWCPNSTFHCMLHMQLYGYINNFALM
jgi:hypothetical protein